MHKQPRIDSCTAFDLKFRIFLLIILTLLFHTYLNLLVGKKNDFLVMKVLNYMYLFVKMK